MYRINSLKRDLVTAISPAAEGWNGLSLRDFSGFRANATLAEMDHTDFIVTNKGFTALDLDGSNDQIQIQHVPPVSLGNFSVGIWVNITSFTGSYMALFERSTGASNNREPSIFINSTGVNYAALGGNDALNRAVPWVIGQWHFFTVVRIAGIFYYYLDGIYRSQSANVFTNVSPSSNSSWWIGNNPSSGGTRLNAQVAEFLAWSRAISDRDILDIYNAGPGDLFRFSRNRRYRITQQVSFPRYLKSSNRLMFPGG